jgi:hypothetical protein
MSFWTDPGGSIGGTLDHWGNVIGSAFSNLGSWVDNNFPGGWAGVGAATLIAIGVTDPDLLSAADSGELTPTMLSDAGVDAQGVQDSLIQVTNSSAADGLTVGQYSQAVQMGMDPGSVADLANGGGFANVDDYLTAQQGGFSTASEYQQAQAMGFNNAEDYATANSEGYNSADDFYADHPAAAEAAGYTPPAPVEPPPPAPVEPPPPAPVEPPPTTTPGPVAGLNTSQVGALAPGAATTAGTSYLGAMGTGALTGAGINGGIDVLTGKPITLSGLIKGAVTGAIGGGIQNFIGPTATALGAAASGAASGVGATVVVDAATGTPITAKSVATSALVGGAFSAGAQAITNGAAGTTTYTYDDGSTLTTNLNGDPITVTTASGQTTNLGIYDPHTGTTTQTYDDGSTLTTDTNGEPISTTQGTETATGGTGGVTELNPTATPDNPLAPVSGTNPVTGGASGYLGATAAGAGSGPAVPNYTGQFLPIPSFTGQNLANPGVNPGWIEPQAAYTGVAPGQDQYYWGAQPYAQNFNQLGQTNPAAPANPYGQASELGQLISPNQLNGPNLQTLAAAQGTSTPLTGGYQGLANMGYDIYNNPVQMNAVGPAIPGSAAVFAAPTQQQSALGTSYAQQIGQGLNYVPNPATLAVTGQNASNPLFAITPQQLSAQLLAQANQAGQSSAAT